VERTSLVDDWGTILHSISAQTVLLSFPCSYVEPKRNRQWWRQKIANNRRRDRRKADHLRSLGYSVITFIEHDSDARIMARLPKH